MKKKLMSLVLALVMCLSLCIPAFAYADDNKCNSETNGSTVEEVIYVHDEQGNLIPVTLVETTYYEENDGITPQDLSPVVPVGTHRIYTVRISNWDVDTAALAGTAISAAMKKAVARMAAEAIAKKVVSQFIPGLDLAVLLYTVASWYNSYCGNDGFEITVDLRYSETYLHAQGYYIYGWDYYSGSIGTY